MATITVYSKTGFCGQCLATKRALENASIDFDVQLLEDVPAAQIERWKAEVGMTAPIVITDTQAGSWSGFRPDKIATLASKR